MPTYEYVCKSCGNELELFQSMKDAPKRKCPKCGKNTLERKIGLGAAVIFKGSGFYQTDYRSEAYKKSAEAEKPAAKSDSKSDGKSEPKSDAKPAKTEAKTESKSESSSKPDTKSQSKPAKSKSKDK
jgi:putative FmdB family regulatory protein